MRFIVLLGAIPLVLDAQAPSGTGAQTSTPKQLFEARRLDEARAAFEELLARNRTDAVAMYYLGRIAASEGRTGDAIGWFEKAVKQDDRSALYHFWLGSALGDEAQRASKLRQPFLARRIRSEFERAVALDPTMLEPRIGLVNFYSIAPSVMGGSMEKARAQVAEIARLNPMRGHLSAARIAMRQKDDSGAVREHESAIRVAPDSTAGYYALASYHRSRNRLPAALTVLDRLIAARPDDMVPHASWGAYAALGGIELERAERELKLFLATPPAETTPMSFANLHLRLGLVFEKTGRPVLAREAYESALRYVPDHADARKALAALR